MMDQGVVRNTIGLFLFAAALTALWLGLDMALPGSARRPAFRRPSSGWSSTA